MHHTSYLLALLSATSLMAGCVDNPEETTTPPLHEGAAGLPVELYAAEVVSHLSSTGAIRMTFTPTGGTCTVLMAAHHVVEYSIDGPWFEVTVDGEYETGTGGDSRPVGGGRVHVGDVDTDIVYDAVMGPATELYWELMGIEDTFTSWMGLPDRNWTGSDVEVLVEFNKGLLSNGTGPTNGGSMRIQVGCTKPFVLHDVREDGEPRLIKGENMDGDVDIVVEPALLEYRAGTYEWETAGPDTEVIVNAYGSRGTLDVSGAFTHRFSWDDIPRSLGPVVSINATGPSGPVVLSWESVGAGLGSFNVSVWSWHDHAWSEVETPTWPWE